MFTVQPLVMALPADYRTSPKLATGSNRGVAGHGVSTHHIRDRLHAARVYIDEHMYSQVREIRDGGAIRLHAFRK